MFDVECSMFSGGERPNVVVGQTCPLAVIQTLYDNAGMYLKCHKRFKDGKEQSFKELKNDLSIRPASKPLPGNEM